MIYLDNAATTVQKPPCVAEAVVNAMGNLGNSGRGVHGTSLTASRVIYDTRAALAALFNAPSPARVAFTSNSTEALNTAILGLFSAGDHVISTDLEHNSVLRPLYLLQQQGVAVDFIPADTQGQIHYEDFKSCCVPIPVLSSAPMLPTSQATHWILLGSENLPTNTVCCLL